MFLQGLMSRGVMPVDEATELLRRITEHEQVNEVPLATFVGRINAELAQLIGLQVKRGMDPNTGVESIALVNTQSDELAKLSSAYTPTEVNFFKRMVQLMFTESDNGNVPFELSPLRALRGATHLKPALSKQDAEAFIGRLEADGWLHNADGVLSLGVRGLLELNAYLKDEYPAYARDCSSCFQILTSRITTCSNPTCDVAMHWNCAANLFRNPVRKVCFKCFAQWDLDAAPVIAPPKFMVAGGGSTEAADGDEAMQHATQDTQEELVPVKKQPDEDDGYEENAGGRASRRQRTTSRRRKRAHRTDDDDDGGDENGDD
nr:Non-structural maintenance of chromosomes element 1 [Polyrhizophydium stewartii]